MPDTDGDLIAALAAYGARIEAEAGYQLRPSPDHPQLIDDTAHLDSAPETGNIATAEIVERSIRPRLWALAAGLLLAVGALVAVRTLTIDNTAIIAAEEDPVSGPLFVLPDPASGATVSNGQLGEQTPDEPDDPIPGGLIARPSNRGYIDLISISIVPASSPSLDLEEFERVGATALFERQVGRSEQLAETRGDTVVLLSTMNGAIDDRLLDMITLNTDVDFDFEEREGYVLLDQWVLDPDTAFGPTPTYELETAGRRYLIETAILPVTLVLDIASRATETSIDARPSWLIEIDDKPYGIAIQHTSTQGILISAADDQPYTFDELAAVAQTLQTVDRTTWLAAFPTLDGPGD